MSKSQISISNLALGYTQKPLLNDINLDICEGDFWGLVGPNGQGKSTFIKALMGLLSPISGKITYLSLSKKEIGYIPQKSSATTTLSMTAEEFVSLAAPGLPFSSKRKAAVQNALNSVWLEDKAKRSFHTLSGGEKQRLSIARALVRNPKLLILDEPDTGLDFTAIGNLMDLLDDLNKNKKMTILLISHSIHTVLRCTSKTALIANGKLTSGNSSEVLVTENITKAFANHTINEDTIMKWLEEEA
ncbi:MAG: metal ABC transporter ATP-binding protein [Lentisphaeraceae bacterium]|nr:metal ABC transporter ATP-binding protein [Lentisphaeraceae bacterium]